MKSFGNLILMTLTGVVIFWIFMAVRPAPAQQNMTDALMRSFPAGAALECGDLRITKSPDGKMKVTGPYGAFSITVKDGQIFIGGQACTWKCADQTVRC